MPDKPDPMEPEFTAKNPIVAAAERLRAKRTVDSALGDVRESSQPIEDAESGLRAFHAALQDGAVRLNSIYGVQRGVKIVRLDRPLRLRIRFRDKRIALDLDDINQLVRISGAKLDGDYQFVPGSNVPALIDVSKVSTEAGYGEALTASSLLKLIARDAELPPPSQMQGGGPLQF